MWDKTQHKVAQYEKFGAHTKPREERAIGTSKFYTFFSFRVFWPSKQGPKGVLIMPIEAYTYLYKNYSKYKRNYFYTICIRLRRGKKILLFLLFMCRVLLREALSYFHLTKGVLARWFLSYPPLMLHDNNFYLLSLLFSSRVNTIFTINYKQNLNEFLY